MSKSLYVLLLGVGCIFFTQCIEDKPELSDVVVFVDPSKDSIVTVDSGDKMLYELEISTIHDYIHRFTISSFDVYTGYNIHVDSLCEQRQNKFAYRFIYSAPEIDREELGVELTFTVEDNKGNIAENKRSLKVLNKLIFMKESNGVVLYNPCSENPNALSFSDVSQTFNVHTSPDSLLADLFIEADEDFSKINWRSKTRAKFVRNNTFNYTMATAPRINSVYSSSVRSDMIRDVRVNDIILVGHNEAEGVFFVENILNRGNSSGEFCIQLSYKGIVR